MRDRSVVRLSVTPSAKIVLFGIIADITNGRPRWKDAAAESGCGVTTLICATESIHPDHGIEPARALIFEAFSPNRELNADLGIDLIMGRRRQATCRRLAMPSSRLAM